MLKNDSSLKNNFHWKKDIECHCAENKDNRISLRNHSIIHIDFNCLSPLIGKSQHVWCKKAKEGRDTLFAVTIIPWRTSITPLYWPLFFFFCSEFCHTLKWNSHGFTCVPHPNPPSHLPLHPLPLGLPSVPGPSTCLMHPTWAGDLFHPRYYTCFSAVLSKHPTLAFSHRVWKTVLYICVFFFFCSAYRVIINIFLNSIYMC